MEALKAYESTKQGMQKRLEDELKRLKHTMNAGYSLKVKWMPENESKFSGEVRGGAIYIYECEERRALEVLKHEFIYHQITEELVKPLVEYVNIQKSLIESLIYRRKEDFVERLSRLI